MDPIAKLRGQRTVRPPGMHFPGVVEPQADAAPLEIHKKLIDEYFVSVLVWTAIHSGDHRGEGFDAAARTAEPPRRLLQRLTLGRLILPSFCRQFCRNARRGRQTAVDEM